MKTPTHEMLRKRHDRLLRLRNLAIDNKNIYKKCQADCLIKQITFRINNIFNFSNN